MKTKYKIGDIFLDPDPLYYDYGVILKIITDREFLKYIGPDVDFCYKLFWFTNRPNMMSSIEFDDTLKLFRFVKRL